jgi:hypothetical protein
MVVKLPQTSHEGEILTTNLIPINERQSINNASATQDNKFNMKVEQNMP